MPDRLTYDVVVVGGGPAGMTTALYTTRLGHRTAVFEREGGRHASVADVHNLYGVSERVSGSELSRHAVDQLEEYGGDYHLDPVAAVRSAEAGDDAGEEDGSGADGAADGTDGAADGADGAADGADGAADGADGAADGADGAADGADGSVAGTDGSVAGADATDRDARFVVEAAHATVGADRVVFATGFSDVPPAVPELQRFAGRGLHYCLHCDAYTLGDSRVFVLGHDGHAAEVAMLLLNVTAEVDLLLDGEQPTWDEETERQLAAHPVDRVEKAVDGAFPEDADAAEPWLGGLRFVDDTERWYRGGFAMYGADYNADLAAELGCDLTDDGAVAVDADGATSVDGAYAVGDVTHGQNQTTIALADGARAGIAIHKDLRRFPMAAEDAAELDDAAVPAAPADLRARMRAMRERDARAGLSEPSPRR